MKLFPKHVFNFKFYLLLYEYVYKTATSTVLFQRTTFFKSAYTPCYCSRGWSCSIFFIHKVKLKCTFLRKLTYKEQLFSSLILKIIKLDTNDNMYFHDHNLICICVFFWLGCYSLIIDRHKNSRYPQLSYEEKSPEATNDHRRF